MDIFKNIFSFQNKPKKEEEEINEMNLPLDESFAHFFTKKDGKFLYCTHQEEVNSNIKHVFEENKWIDALCLDDDLQKMLLTSGIYSTERQTSLTPFFTTCEQLIAKDGSILFSSNQLKGFKISELPVYFVVFARTSQIVYSNDDALMNIKLKKNIPSGIASIKSYNPNKKTNDFMDYGSINTKNLYLLLLEDL